MEKFILVLGSGKLPGNQWTQYNVDVLEDKMVCTQKKILLLL